MKESAQTEHFFCMKTKYACRQSFNYSFLLLFKFYPCFEFNIDMAWETGYWICPTAWVGKVNISCHLHIAELYLKQYSFCTQIKFFSFSVWKKVVTGAVEKTNSQHFGAQNKKFQYKHHAYAKNRLCLTLLITLNNTWKHWL